MLLDLHRRRAADLAFKAHRRRRRVADASPAVAGQQIRYLSYRQPRTGAAEAGLYFVAWDASQGKAGSVANISIRGGATPFSVNAGTLALTVNPAPSWVGAGTSLTPLLPGNYLLSNPTTPAGNTIASVIGNYFQDNNPDTCHVNMYPRSKTRHGPRQRRLAVLDGRQRDVDELPGRLADLHAVELLPA